MLKERLLGMLKVKEFFKMREFLLRETSTMANLKNLQTTAHHSTSAMAAKSLTLVALLIVSKRWPMLSNVKPRKRIYSVRIAY